MTRLKFNHTPTDLVCNLRCGRCDSVKVNGERCRNRVCFGYPTCWIHTIQTFGVRIRPSPGRGKGLFATKRFASGEWICPYNGEAITRNCVDSRYPGDLTAPYTTRVNNNLYQDAACMRGIGSMANGKFTRGGVSRRVQEHNAVISRRRTGLWLKARRVIHVDREIFVHYGTEYRLERNHKTYRTNRPDNRPC